MELLIVTIPTVALLAWVYYKFIYVSREDKEAKATWWAFSSRGTGRRGNIIISRPSA